MAESPSQSPVDSSEAPKADGGFGLPDHPVVRFAVKASKLPWVQYVSLSVIVLLAMLYYQFVPGFADTPQGTQLQSYSPGLPCADGYYHIKVAYLYRVGEVQAAGANFHWTRESVWGHSFSDKDYLFHLYLVPFTLLADGPDDADGLVLAGKFGAAGLGLILALALFAVMRGFKLRFAWLFTLSAVVVGSSYFVFRMNLCRSFVFSVALALLGWFALARANRWGLFFLAAVYTLSYTASHLLLAMALVRAVMEFVLGPVAGRTRALDIKKNAILMGFIAAGIAVGCALHPQSLELMKLWWVQNVVVLALSHRDTVAPAVDNISNLLGMSINLEGEVPISLGLELEPPKGQAVIFSTPLIFFPPLLLPLWAAMVGHKPSREAVLTGTITVVWLVAYMVNVRFLEYAAPFATLSLAIWLNELMAAPSYGKFLQQRPVWSRALPISAALLSVIVGAMIWSGAAWSYRIVDRGDIEPAARWLHENPETHGKFVWHDRWDDFTEFLFFCSECDYMVGLDPTFMLVNDRERYQLWWDITKGKRADGVQIIREQFKADYILQHRSSSEYFYHKLNEEAQAGRLKLCIRDANDEWALYEVVK